LFYKDKSWKFKFFSWYITAIVIPFVNECRSLLSIELEDDHFYLVADGEEVQIKPIDDDEINNALIESRIDLGKGPASCTDTVGNACDRSNLFKASKKILKSHSSITVNDYRDPILENKITSTISENHPSITKAKAQFMSAGVVKIVRSLAKAVNYQVIQHGFARIGVYPLDHRQCLKNCDKDTLLQYESHVIDDIVDKVPTLATLFLDIVNGGQLTETQLDDAGIPLVPNNDRRTMDKDQRSQSHQRVVMLSN
jgi:hypothetical protein